MALAEAVVEVTADTSHVGPQLRAGLRSEAAAAGRALDAGLKEATDRTGDDIGRKVARDANGRLRDERGKFVAEGRSAGDATGRSFSDSFKNALGFQAASAALSAGLAPLKALASGLGFSVIAAQAAAAAASVIQFAGALLPIAGIAAALPGVLAGGAAALITFKVALSGVGDAFSAAASGDAEKFEEAIKKLAPAAQNVAREFFALQPALNEFRNTVQQAFFAEFEGQLTAVADTLLGPLSQGMASVAAAGGAAVNTFAEFAQEAQTVSFLQSLFDATGVSVENLAGALQPVLAGFRDLAGVALPLLGSLSGGIASAAAQFGTFLQQAVASGQATAWIDTALQVLGQLGTIALQVGGILEAVFRAAGSAGGDVLGVLGTLLTSVNAFLSSGEGQAALVEIFRTLNTVGQQLGPIFVALGTAIGALAPIIAQIAIALGPAIQTAITALGEGLAALGPALIPIAQGIATAFTAIAPALGPLGASIGQILTAIAPLLPVVGQLVALVATNLSTALQALAAVIAPVVTAIAGALVPVFPQLIAAATQLAPVFIQLATIVGGALGTALEKLLPPILAILPQLISGLIPAVTQLATSFGELIPEMAPVVTALAESLLPILPALIPLIVSIAELFAALAPVIIKAQAPLLKLVAVIVTFLAEKAIVPLIELIAKALVAIINPITSVVNFFGRLQSAFSSIDWSAVGAAIGNFVNTVINFFTALPGRIIAAITALPGLLLQFFGFLLSQVYDLFTSFVAGVITLLITLPGLIIEAVTTLPGLITDFFTNLWSSVLELATTGVTNLVTFVSELPGKIFAVIEALPGQLSEFFTNMWNSITETVSTGISNVVNLISEMPGKIANFVTNFVNAGKDLIAGLLDGLQDVASGTLDTLGSKIVGVVKSGINSGISAINSFIRDVNAKIPGGDPIPQIPRLAKGGIINKETLAIIGEAGPEVVIPLTRPARARQLAEQSGLLQILAGNGDSGHSQAPPSARGTVNNNITIQTPATNPEIVAHRVLAELARSAR